eukprot:bmy_16825T0
MLLVLLLLPMCWAVEVKRPRGVSLTNHHFYDESKPFTCLDGSASVPFDQAQPPVPTAASTAPTLATSPCTSPPDGSTMEEKGRKERETLQQMAEVTREGFRLKKILIEDWKKAREEKQEEAEKPEKEAKDQHRKLWEEQLAASKAQREQELATSAFQELDDDMDGAVSVAELQTHPELDTDGDGALSEGEAQTLLGGDTQTDAASFSDRIWAAIRDKYRSEVLPTDPPSPSAADLTEPKEEQPPVPSQPTEEEDEEEEETEEEEEGEEGEEEDSQVQGEQPKETPSPVVPPQTASPTEEDKMPPYDEQTQAFINAAQEARNKFEEAERSLKDVEESIRNLEQEISFDFGPNGEFAYLYSQCYELTTNECVPHGQAGWVGWEVLGLSKDGGSEGGGLRSSHWSLRYLCAPCGGGCHGGWGWVPPTHAPHPVTGTSTGSAPSSSSRRNPNSVAPPPASGEWAQAGPPSQPLVPPAARPAPLSTPLSRSTWGSWAGPDHDKFSAMKYEQGTGCWQGPNRSTTVRLLCGKETVVTSTTEPSRCEYLMELMTPAACPEPPPEPPAEGNHDEL